MKSELVPRFTQESKQRQNREPGPKEKKNKAKEEGSERKENVAEWEQVSYKGWKAGLSNGHYMLFACVY